MKKLLLIASIFCASFASQAQNIILCEDFNAYDSASAASGVFNGFVISYHSQNSFYTSTQSSGNSGPNSYKFGVDSATMVSPNIIGATYLQFWMKGNATDSLSTFFVYDSPDGNTWTEIANINPVNTTGMYRQYALNPGASYVRFYYTKSVGNVAFDDFCTTDGPVSVGEVTATSAPSIFPNPSNGIISISGLGSQFNACNVSVLNLLGKEVRSFNYSDLGTSVKSLDLSGLDKGVYLLRFKSENAESIQRVVLKD